MNKQKKTKIIYDTITKIFTFLKKNLYNIYIRKTLQARLQPGGGRFYHAKKKNKKFIPAFLLKPLNLNFRRQFFVTEALQKLTKHLRHLEEKTSESFPEKRVHVRSRRSFNKTAT